MEVKVVINNVPIYQLRVNRLQDEPIVIGKGLSYEELGYLSVLINDHLCKLKIAEENE